MVSVPRAELDASVRFPALGTARNPFEYNEQNGGPDRPASCGVHIRIASGIETEPLGDLLCSDGLAARLLQPGRPYSNFTSIDFRFASLRWGHCAADLALRGQWPENSFVIAVVEGAKRAVMVTGRPFRQGTIALFKGGEEFDAVVPQATTWTYLLVRTAGRNGLRAMAGIQDPSRVPPNVPLQLLPEHRARITEAMRALVDAPASLSCQSRQRGAAESREGMLVNLFIDSLLAALPTPAIDRARQRRYDLTRRVERKALQEGTEPMRLPKLAEAAGASPRLLEYAYRELYGMGAMQYLRLLRLNEVHRALRRPEHPELTITSVAFDWGFFHLGDFSAAYKRLFGETPSRTLKRGRQAIRRMEGAAE